jgi:hypothetical protein
MSPSRRLGRGRHGEISGQTYPVAPQFTPKALAPGQECIELASGVLDDGAAVPRPRTDTFGEAVHLLRPAIVSFWHVVASDEEHVDVTAGAAVTARGRAEQPGAGRRRVPFVQKVPGRVDEPLAQLRQGDDGVGREILE